MKYTSTLSILASIAILAVTPVFGQESGERAQDAANHQRETERKTPTFVVAPMGAEAFIDDETGHHLGTISDHVIDRKTGEVLFVVINPMAEREQARLVPFSRFSWNMEQKHLVLPVSQEFLLSSPKFDPKQLNQAGDLGARAGEAAETREASMGKELPRRLMASKLVGSNVLATAKKFGSLTQLLLDPKHGTIAFVLVNEARAASDPYIVPWKALKLEMTETKESQFALPLTLEQLAEAPRLTGGDFKILTKKETLKNIHGFYKMHKAEHPPKPVDHQRG